MRERFVQHGKIITAAGVSAGIDMALWLVRERADEPTMRAAQLLIEYDPQPPLPMMKPPATREERTDAYRRESEQRTGSGRSRRSSTPAD